MQIKRIVILISANSEWKAVKALFSGADINSSPYGEWFDQVDHGANQVSYFQGGWGKIAAAASTQYVIDRWKPDLLINLGTCGGFAGEIAQGAFILANETIVYDIIEQMGDFDEHIAHYRTHLDLSWLREPYPQAVKLTRLVSADRDLLVEEIPMLKSRYSAVAGDWESGAIAWVAARNHTRLIILRGVTDLVGAQGDLAYGNLEYFHAAAAEMMPRLVAALPGWLAQVAW